MPPALTFRVDTLCVHGNPNVLTTDIGTSRLAQGCTGQHAWVEVEPWTGEAPVVRAFDPPVFAERKRLESDETVVAVAGVASRELAGAVVDQAVGELVLQDLGILDVADGVGGLLNKRGHALVALAAETDRLIHGRSCTHPGLPFRAHL